MAGDGRREMLTALGLAVSVALGKDLDLETFNLGDSHFDWGIWYF